MIAPGALVTVRQYGLTAWVVERREAGRWHVVSKGIDDRGRAVYFGRVAGEGDIALITPAPVYEAGTTVEHNGMQHVVASDNGDSITLTVPDSRRPLRGGGHLHIAAGNTITLAKSDLALEELK